ncbi:Gfo/Idh/MocA family oxidoreductase [Sphingosinicella sp. BN140058]|uniref:Gfo/Idh/MocA family oxidoreductase n=1 Tax=Sphingosinicella sp. BN140058 TaxID=1892855 RepID=UPI001FB09955|nr:Gfo/Idh/MocA family oxidoreductase [Sphingosinicella sp. BN140058]
MAGTVFHAPLIRSVADLELVATAGSADAAALLADPSIDLVVIATPNRSHYPLAEAALQAGKHVVVDKPLTVTSAEAVGLITLAAERERMLTVFQNRRWDGDFLTVRDVLAGGRLGEIALFEAHWDRFRPAIKPGWREVPAEGAGLFFDLGAHLIDQALILFGTPEALTADIGAQRAAADVDDYFRLTLHYGRLRVNLSAATLVTAPRPRFAVYGTAGALVKYGLDPQEAALRDGIDPRSSGFGEDSEARYATFTDVRGEPERIPTQAGRYRDFYAAVARAVRGEGPVPVDPADARAALRIIELARESARERRRIAL